MAAKRSTDHTPGQLGLGLSGHVEAMDIECRGLLSSIYLRKVLPSQTEYPTVAETQQLYETVKARWLKHWLWLARQNEDYTRTQFLDPLLKELGWHFIVSDTFFTLDTKLWMRELLQRHTLEVLG